MLAIAERWARPVTSSPRAIWFLKAIAKSPQSYPFFCCCTNSDVTASSLSLTASRYIITSCISILEGKSLSGLLRPYIATRIIIAIAYNAGCAVWQHIAVISRTSSARRNHCINTCTDGRWACLTSFSFVPFTQLKKHCLQSIVLKLYRASSSLRDG